MVVVVAPLARDGAESSQALSTAAAGDSSPSSAESSFRELDDVFLQTQTRIWLGEVLHTRLDEQLQVADLLADGQLLFEVAREIWKMLLKNRMELRSISAFKDEPFAYKKRSGRYMPYSNVDSFLKICKILGLSGIDLFSPSDVVEKRDTRKVCMCIRSLSMKARSRNLNVPDFDIVTYTLSMPTEMVGCIRRSWELSRCSSSSSASHSPYHKSRGRLSKKHSDAPSTEKYESDTEGSDDAESNFRLQFNNSEASCAYGIPSEMKSDVMSSVKVSSAGEDYYSEQCSLNLSRTNQDKDRYCKDQWAAICVNESAVHVRQQFESDHQLDGISSLSFTDSDIQLQSAIEVRNSSKSIALNPNYVDPSQEDGSSVVGDSGDGGTPGENHIDDPSAMFGTIHDGTGHGDAILLSDEDSTFHTHAQNSSVASTATSRVFEDEFRGGSSADDVEVSSIASMSSVSGVVRNLDFDDHLEPEDDFRNFWFPESPNNKMVLPTIESVEVSKSQDIGLSEDSRLRVENAEESPSAMKVMDVCFSSNQLLPCSDTQSNTRYVDSSLSQNNGICMTKINSNVVHGQDTELFDDQSSSQNEVRQWDQKGKCINSVVPIGNDGHGSSSPSLSQVDLCKEAHHFAQTKATGDANIDGREQENLHNLAKDNPEEMEDLGVVETAERKPQRRQLLKSVASGTAVVGVFLLFLHLRKNSRDKMGKPGTQSDRMVKGNGGALSSQKERKGSRRNGVYPAEKFRFGD